MSCLSTYSLRSFVVAVSPWIVVLVAASLLPASHAIRGHAFSLSSGGPYTGQSFEFGGESLMFGDMIGEGKQGSVYRVKGGLVAKVALEKTKLPFDRKECFKNQKLHEAGVQTPQCYGQSTFHPAGTAYQLPVLLFEELSGDTLLNLFGQAGVNCTDLKGRVLMPLADEFAKTINAGYANADQHMNNVMFDGDKVWLIDHGYQFAARQHVSHEWFMKMVYNMGRKYVRGVHDIVIQTACGSDITPTDLYDYFVTKLDGLEEKRRVCECDLVFDLKACSEFGY